MNNQHIAELATNLLRESGKSGKVTVESVSQYIATHSVGDANDREIADRIVEDIADNEKLMRDLGL